MDKKEDCQRYCARIVKLVEDHKEDLEKHLEMLKFLCSVNNDLYEEVLSYNEVMQYMEKDGESDILWKYKRITAHEGPLTKNDETYNGSKYNVMIEWENGEITSEPLSVIAADDPVTSALYALENDLLHIDGWKQFKSIARRKKKLVCMVKQAKLRSYKYSSKYMFGFEVPRDYQHAIQLDKKKRNTR